MRIYNSKKLIQILFSGFLLFNLAGCGKKEIKVEEKLPENKPVEKETISEDKSVENLEKKEQNSIKVSTEKENETMNEINEYYEKMNEYLNSEDFKEKEDSVLQYFFLVTDFLFYNAPINGVTMKEISVETQLKLISLYEKMDSMIEERYPNYQEKAKEKFGETTQALKEKTSDVKEYLIDKTKEKIGEEKYNEYVEKIEQTTNKWKETYEEFKGAHGEEIKQGASDFVEKAKEEGTKLKDKVNDWYQNLKKEHQK